MLYFAYGSNMDRDQMKGRAPSAEFLCVAQLKGHRLAFSRRSKHRGGGSADAVFDPGQEVWGVVYQIDERDFEELDRAEDIVPGRAQNGYHRDRGRVYADGDEKRPLEVYIYFAVKEKDPPLPSARYMKQIIRGATHWGLPKAYIERLERIGTAG